MLQIERRIKMPNLSKELKWLFLDKLHAFYQYKKALFTNSN